MLVIAQRSIVLGALACLLASTAACDTGPEEGKEAEYWGQKLKDPKKQKRELAVNNLVKLKEKEPEKAKKALPFLYDALKADPVHIKPKVVSMIGDLGDESSIPELTAAIDYKAGAGSTAKGRAIANTNEAIAKALPKLAKEGNEKAIGSLTRLANVTHQNTQLAAINSLGQLKAKSAVQDLIDIADGHINNFMVKNAAEALGKIGDPKAIPVLIKLLFFERTGVSFYRESSYALFLIGKPAVAPLIEVYNAKYEPIEEMHVAKGVQQAKALQVLGDISGQPEVVKLAKEAASLPTSDTAGALSRTFGIQMLGKYGVTSAKPIFLKTWDDIDQSISEHALQALVQIGATDLAPQLLAMSTFDGFVKQCMSVDKRNKKELCEAASPQVRPARLGPLSQIAPGSMLPAFEKMLKEEKNKKVKKVLTKGINRVKAAKECDGKGEECWIKLLKHENPRYQERAAYQLMWDGPTKTALPHLIENLSAKENEARYPAILAVWRTLPKEAVAKIEKTLAAEKGRTQYVRINEELKRLLVKIPRGY